MYFYILTRRIVEIQTRTKKIAGSARIGMLNCVLSREFGVSFIYLKEDSVISQNTWLHIV